MTLGDVRQWLLLRGPSAESPILLKLRGGPGQAEMATFRSFFAEGRHDRMARAERVLRGLSVVRITVLVMTTDSALSLPDGRQDFDFLHGHWHSRQRKLRKRLVNCQDWDEFTANLHCQPVLGGLGNFDELASPAMTYTGLALRLYDQATRAWSIYWIAGGLAAVDPPVVGHFADGVGDFLSPDTQEGRPVLVRYRWSDITPTSARWAQAFSVDDGVTWETNWTADFTRAVPRGG